MNTSNVFIHLVKQDLKRRGRRNRRISRQWLLIYMAVFLLFALIVATYNAIQGNINLETIWYYTFFVPFAVFGITIGLTVHEWKNGTAGWWLSLPYPRIMLVYSKFCAGLIKGVFFILVIFLTVALLGLYILLLNGHFQMTHYLLFLNSGWHWFAFLICVSPFMASFGLLYSVLRESIVKNILPIFWFGWGIMWWLISSSLGNYFTVHNAFGFTFSTHTLYVIAGSLVVAYVCIRLSAYVLDRHLAL